MVGIRIAMLYFIALTEEVKPYLQHFHTLELGLRHRVTIQHLCSTTCSAMLHKQESITKKARGASCIPEGVGKGMPAEGAEFIIQLPK